MNIIPNEIIIIIIIYFVKKPKNIINFKLISKKMNNIFISMLNDYSINFYSRIYIKDIIKIEKKICPIINNFCCIDPYDISKGLNLELNIPIIEKYLSLIDYEVNPMDIICIIDRFFGKIFKYFETHNIKINIDKNKLTIIYENKDICIKIIEELRDRIILDYSSYLINIVPIHISLNYIPLIIPRFLNYSELNNDLMAFDNPTKDSNNKNYYKQEIIKNNQKLIKNNKKLIKNDSINKFKNKNFQFNYKRKL